MLAAFCLLSPHFAGGATSSFDGIFIHCLHFCQHHMSAVYSYFAKQKWMVGFKQAVLLRCVCIYVFVYFAFVLATSQRVGFLTSGALGAVWPPLSAGCRHR